MKSISIKIWMLTAMFLLSAFASITRTKLNIRIVVCQSDGSALNGEGVFIKGTGMRKPS
ncbi:MAG: hypothetical protein ABIN48_08430 [Ginsengibacter sp.]